ncbi:glycosyltransferase [Tamlana fucoidanivorans]|uniref:Glycosyltransferase n=1 Tax=Allotamlana fucoidanivorans TaxID=2583814 RepID=A0A5C4SL64_9FLAO|nr:glycosyltransferase [Tamlana fucoidanivorans]
MLEIVCYAFIAVVIIQALFYVVVFSKLAFYKKKKKAFQTSSAPLSVIICAKNEADNLKTFLPYIINQDYPEFEIVLINDASNDDTFEVMEHFSSLHANIKVVNVKSIEAFWGNKKYALTLGIKAAKYDLFIFTDADCKPLSKYWLQDMAGHFSSEKTIVLGYSPYAKIKNSFLNKLIRFETLMTAVHYFSFALSGLPYMGVGRNLGYTKDTFFKANGFINHIQVKSGDDDLFVNQVANSKNTAISLSKKSFTESKPKTSFKSWYKQKRRHVSTASFYKTNHKLILGLLYITNLLFWVLSILLFAFNFQWQLVLALFLFRMLLQYIFIGKSSKKLLEKDLILLFPLLEFFLVFIQLTIFINNLISKPNHWK